PRMRMVDEPPGRGSASVICTPVACPRSISDTLVDATEVALSTFTVDTELITSLFRWVPYPTTTTSSSERTSSAKVTSINDRLLTTTSCVMKPMAEKTSTAFSPVRLMEY